MSPSQKSLSIKQWSVDDRPREKLIHKGKSSLSDAELLAILIGSGNRDESAVELCKRVLHTSEHSLHKLAKFNLKQLQEFKGIGEAKAISILAALELGSRRGAEPLGELTKITSSKDVFRMMHPFIGDLDHEQFWVLMLNNSNKVIYKLPLSKGGITATMVDTRLVFKSALAQGATALILTHNHPSGALKPSQADIDITKKIKNAGELLDIKVLDHIIVTEKTYFSFADESLL
ncbi:JAB domain-containing protein [Psychroflexus sp. YR1-1]|uniref:JAB domain-containing protein n=1 Tax=Psychroflexus aurantiacus TaxID=2709310 RepID=A0A6B3R6K3_9FLAO|nr:DNA repair protein RadC [Psychroflexus aurantiacus]NEV94767.1 JAB domain-containing protein [Psychroflexus aurantiacus]